MSGAFDDRWRVGGWAVNVLLRLLILGYATEAVRATEDPRFEGKGLAVRHVVLGGSCLTLVFPLRHAWHRPRHRYPVWTDALFLSILTLDMAFNSLDLYERRGRFDLFPHTYGPAAGFAVLRQMGVAAVPGALIVNGFHVLLEIQEALGDALFGTHNVHGWWDTLTDLGAGLVGSVAIPLAWTRLRRRRPAPRPSAPHRSYSPA
jgi:hypothetical protein